MIFLQCSALLAGQEGHPACKIPVLLSLIYLCQFSSISSEEKPRRRGTQELVQLEDCHYNKGGSGSFK